MWMHKSREHVEAMEDFIWLKASQKKEDSGGKQLIMESFINYIQVLKGWMVKYSSFYAIM